MNVPVWTRRRAAVAVAAAVMTALVLGVPTGIIETPFYTRMTPVVWWNYPVWAGSAVLTALVFTTYVRGPATGAPVTGRAGVGGVLSLFAVGCPICNKLVVSLIGVSGALNVWAPVQPVLGAAGLLLLGYALRVRVRAERSCATATGRDLDSESRELRRTNAITETAPRPSARA